MHKKIASVIAFVLFAGYFIINHDFDTHIVADKYLVAAVISTAIYFFYVNSAAEEKWTNNGNGLVKYLDGFLKIVQYLCFYTIWFSLRFGLDYFAYLTLIIFITFTIYNLAHCKTVFSSYQGISIFIFDTIGLFIGMLLIWSIRGLPNKSNVTINEIPEIANAVSVSSALIITSLIGLIFAILTFSHNPFKKDVVK